MKTFFCIVFCFLLSNLRGAGQDRLPRSLGGAPTSEYRTVERGEHYRVVERTLWEAGPDGQEIAHTVSYVELATGMHYLDRGEWRESSPDFQITQDGSAVARRGLHRVRVAPNINTPEGAVELVLPNGKRLRSAVLGLNLFDAVSGKTVQVAAVRDAAGQQTAENEITFFDCFEGLSANVRIRNEIGQFHQEVTLNEKLTSEQLARLGFDDPTNVRLEIWTEFLDPPQPKIESALLRSESDPGRRGQMAEADVVDHFLDFDGPTMPQGKAFVEHEAGKSARVFKQWLQNQEGRVCLVEAALFTDLQPLMHRLPTSKIAALAPRKTSPAYLANRLVPERATPVTPRPKPIVRLADASGKGPGPQLVLDYVVVTSSLTNFTFMGDTTYLITNAVALRGTTTLEGGSVIKYSSNPSYSPSLVLYGSLKCLTDPYRPAVFTSSDDNAVGATISGSSGAPSTLANAIYLDAEGPGTAGVDWVFKCGRMAYAMGGFIAYDGLQVKVQHSQFLNCTYACGAPGSGNVRVQNSLFSGCAYPLYGNGYISAENVTACGYTTFAQCAVNLLGLAVTNTLAVGPATWIGRDSGSGTLPTPVFDHSTNLSSATGVFQRVGAGDFYLAAGSFCRNAGTTNIAPDLLADLRLATTYPPVVYSNATISSATTFLPQAQRDTDVPDLGFHYAPLDYVFGGVTANSNLTFTVGTAAAWFRTTSGWYHAGHGIHLADSRQISFNGQASAPVYWVRYNTVQEGVNGVWAGGYGPGGITGWATTRGLAPRIQARFLRASVLGDEGGSVNHFRDDWGYLLVCATHSEFWGGGLGAYVSSHYHTNCLFDRTWVWLDTGQTDNEYIFRNCTFKGNYFSINRSVGNYVSVRDCIFDSTLFPYSDSYTSNPTYTDYAYNAFLTGAIPNRPSSPNDLFVTTYNWQSAMPGRFYLPTNSPLVDAGTVIADVRGLYHFTTQTNQIKEAGSLVDRGYHYVAVDASGSPCDVDGDGWFDYVEDADGDGEAEIGERNWRFPDNCAWQLGASGWKTSCEDKFQILVTNLTGVALTGGRFDLFAYFNATNASYVRMLLPWGPNDVLANGATHRFTFCSSDHSIANFDCVVVYIGTEDCATSQRFRITVRDELARVMRNTTQISAPGPLPQPLPTSSTVQGASPYLDNFYKASDPPESVNVSCPKHGFKNVYAIKQWHGRRGFNSITGDGTTEIQGDGGCAVTGPQGQADKIDTCKYLAVSAEASHTVLHHDQNGSTTRSAQCSRTRSIGRYSGKTTYGGQNTGEADLLPEAQALLGFADNCNRGTPLSLYRARLEHYANLSLTYTTTYTFTGGGGAWTATIDREYLGSSLGTSRLSVDISSGTFTNHEVEGSNVIDETLVLGAASMRYTKSNYSLTEIIQGEPCYGLITDSLSATLTVPYTSAQVDSDCDCLLAQWDLLDDAQYPWRTDGGLNRGPLVTHNERCGDLYVAFSLINYGTEQQPDWRAPVDTSEPPWPSCPEGSILGAPLPVHWPNGDIYSFQPYFNFYHKNYRYEETAIGHPEAVIHSYGASSPFTNATQWIDDAQARFFPAGPFWAYGSALQASDHFMFSLKNPFATDPSGEWETGGIGPCLIKCKWAETIDAPPATGKDFLFKRWKFNFRDFIDSYRWNSAAWCRNNMETTCPALSLATPVRFNPVVIPLNQLGAGYYIGPGSWWIEQMDCLPIHYDFDCCRPAVFIQPGPPNPDCANGITQVTMPPAVCDDHYGSLWMGRVDQTSSDADACLNYVANRNGGAANPAACDPQIELDLIWHPNSSGSGTYELFVVPLGFSVGGNSPPALNLRLVSRDKFLAGSIEIPSGMESLEMEVRNVTSGENLGRYGSLLGGGGTKIYNSIEEILSDEDLAAGGQSESQRIWFIRDQTNPRKLDFYTCFNDIGVAQIDLHHDGHRVQARKHTLFPAQDFSFWINYVDNWVKGVGFDFAEPPLPTPTFSLSGLPPSSPPPSGPLNNLTRACLIPVFNVVAQVEGMEAVALGVLEGVKSGLHDDWDLGQTIVGGGVTAGNWAWSQVQAELLLWRDQPLKRALELKRAVGRIAVDGVFTPLQAVSQDLSTWNGFKERAWTTWESIRGSAVKVWTVGQSFGQHIAGGLASWFDDFNGRMLQGGERVAFQNTPWNQDPLLTDLAQFGHQAAYTFGYVFGYLGEQVGVGLLTGGTLKVAQVMVKGGVTLAGSISSKVLVQVAARSHLLKKQLASVAVSLELRSAIERGLVQATKTPVSSTILDSAGVVVETHLSRSVVDRNLFNLRTLVEAAIEKPNTRKLFEQTGTEWLLLHRFALFMSLTGDAADHTLLNNFLRVFESRLVVQEAAGTYVDWTEDFLRSLEGIITRFTTRPPLVPLDTDQLARLNELLRPAGSVWTMPPIGDTTRGCIGEVHLANTEYRTWQWSPAAAALDFYSFSQANIAAQLKISRSPSVSSLRIAIDRLVDRGTTQGATYFILDLRKPPGLDTTVIESSLRQYIWDTYPSLWQRISLTTREYEFVPY